MQKVVFILVVFLITSCSALKRGNIAGIESVDTEVNKPLKDRITGQNISNGNFYISKAEVEIRSETEKQKFIAIIKFNAPANYLISLRSKSGIEAARIFISKDTLLINDRINRKLYTGRPDYINRKYGIPVNMLPAVFGDLISTDTNIVIPECLNGSATVNTSTFGLFYQSDIDCKKAKVIRLKRKMDANKDSFTVDYSKFYRNGKILIPSSISIVSNETTILIRILKMEIPWEGNIEFIPGNRYEVISLK